MRTFADLDRALSVARHAVEVGGAAARAWWQREPVVETKADRSPVSQADRDADAAILGVISSAYPDHDVLSEESGVRGPGTCDCRWIVDPLDGTRGFLRGDATWGPLVALEYQGELVVAAMHMPVTGEIYVARRGGGAYRDGERLQVSSIASWRSARLVLGYLGGLLAEPHGRGVVDLIRSADQVRCPGDLAAVALVLEGRAEVWLEAGVREWDLAAPRLLLEEAGGRFTDFLGRPTHAMGVALGSNARLHADALSALCGA